MTILVCSAEFRKSKENQAKLLNTSNADFRLGPMRLLPRGSCLFDHIRRTFPQAADLLSLMLRLNHQAIPQFLIQSIIDTLVFSEVTAMLLNFSLVRAEIGQQTFEVQACPDCNAALARA